MSVVVAIIALLLSALFASKGIVRNFRLNNAIKLTANSPVADIYNEKGELSVKAWYESSNVANFKFSSSTATTISSWYDISGNGLHLTQTDSDLYPTYVPNAINNLPAIEFGLDGDATSWLGGKSPNLAMGDDTYSIAMVWVTQDVSRADGTSIVYIGKSTVSNGTKISLVLNDDEIRFSTHGGGFGTGNTALFSSLTANTPYATIVVKNDSAVSSWNNHATFYDGSGLDNSFCNAIPEKIILGDSTISGNLTLDGYISEFILFDKALSNTEAESVLDYLGKKWNIRTN